MHHVARIAAKLGVAVAIVFLFAASSQDAMACNYKVKLKKYNDAVAKWQANPTPNNAARVCQKRDSIKRKFPNKPLPPLPPGVNCGGGGAGGGGGRGGVPGGGAPGGGGPGVPGGGGIGPAGGSVPMNGWIRNIMSYGCTYQWAIIANPANPAGFTVTPSSGSLFVSANSDAFIPFDVIIDPSVPAGTIACFNIYFLDTCTGQLLGDEFSEFKVMATGDISVQAHTPAVYTTVNTVISLGWTITNHSANTVTKTYSFVDANDPASGAELNDGRAYDVINMFPVNKNADQTKAGGGSFTLGPFESMDIFKEDVVAGEYCDVPMTGCCGLAIDGMSVCTNTFNSHDEGYREVDPQHTLQGYPEGGYVTVDVMGSDGHFTLAAETWPDISLGEVIDQLAIQGLTMAYTVNGFNYIPVVNENGLFILHDADTKVEFQSFDPGLKWMVQDVNVEPIDPDEIQPLEPRGSKQ